MMFVLVNVLLFYLYTDISLTFYFVICLFSIVRHNANQRRATEVSGKLKDNRDLQHFLQNTQDVSTHGM